ncbi:MAG: Fic family protein [Candidatus Omnitrophota bacterium]
MKMPENAPNLKELQSGSFEKLFLLQSSKEMFDIAKLANKEYFYWDKFKYLSFPETVPPDLAWIALKLTRNSQIRKTPLRDTGDRYFGYWLPDEALKYLHDIDQKASGQILVDDPVTHAGEKERYLVNSIMEEAIASSQLEGAAITREKAKEMLRAGKKPADIAEQMILNNYLTIKNIKKIIDKPLSPELIIEIQASITKDTLENVDAVGRFKKQGEEYQVVDQEDGMVLFDPPPVNEIKERVQALCDYANETGDDTFIHPVVKATVLHFWLAYIHPFVDGNGRTSRALFYWYMLKNNYWLFEYLSISRILYRSPAQYKRAFIYSEIDEQDMTYFLMFNMRAINLSIKSLHLYLARKQQEFQETIGLIRKYPGLNHRQYDLLYHAVSHPQALYTVKFQQNVHNVAYQTARTDLLELEKKGFLSKIQAKGKEFAFVPSKELHSKIKNLLTRGNLHGGNGPENISS